MIMKPIPRQYKQWNDDLKNRYLTSFKEDKRLTTIWDGVIFPEEYAKTPLKIMFLNREAYDPEPDNHMIYAKQYETVYRLMIGFSLAKTLFVHI